MKNLTNRTILHGIALLALWCGAYGRTDTSSAIVTELADRRLKTPITLRAKDANISEVLKVLSENSGMNFVAGEDVKKERITIILNKTPLDEAINLIVRAAGLAYEVIGNAVLIAPPERLKEKVGRMGYVIKLRYVPAREAANILSDLTENVKIDEGGNRLICYTSPGVIREIEQIIREIDHPHILVMLETRLIEATTDDLKRYGLDWGSFSPFTFDAEYEEHPVIQGFNLDRVMLGKMSVKSRLDFMLSEGTGQVLMDSKLMTTNNREASLHIGEVIPYTVQSYNLSGSGGANYQIQKEAVGVKLNMKPHVNEENQVTLTIEPEASSIAGWKGPSSDIPLVRVRKTKTTVRVENGQTIFLAGLLSEEKTLEVRKLPLLGQIPLLGRLFQHRKVDFRKSNLIIQITPRIIHDPKESMEYRPEIDEK